MKSFKQIWWIALVVKTLFAIWLPFSNDEAYYWVWGHHPQLSYFDHPPVVGWLFSIGTLFENLGNGARLPGVWLGHATILVWYQILKPYMSERLQSFWLVFVLFSPFVGVASFIVTPDVPLMFFWALSLLLLLKLLERPTFFLYAAFGAVLGAGFCSKYMIVLFVPAALLWLGFSGEWRKVRWAFAPVTIFFGLIFCLPVLVWNAQHEWASFAFQLNHGLGGETRKLSWPFEYIAGQIGILFPTTVYFALRSAFRSRATTGRDLTPSFLHFFGWFPVAFFLYSSFKAHVEANWPMMAHPALLSLAVLGAPFSKWLKGTVVVWAAALLLIVSQLLHPWIPLNPNKLETSEFTRFDKVAEVAAEMKDRPFYLGSYQMAAAVSYKLRRQIYKLNGVNRRDFYDFAPQSKPKDDTFFVCLETSHPLPEWLNANQYSHKLLRKLGEDYSIYEVTRRAKDTGI